MKTLITLSLFAALIPISLMSQTVNKHYLIGSQALHKQTTFKVLQTNQLSTTKTATVGSFKLQPGELKAVVKVESHPTKIETIPLPIMKEISPKAKLFALPEVYYAREKNTNNQLSYQILYVDKEPLRLDFRQKSFRGLIRFYAIEPDYLDAPQPMGKQLAAPEEILVTFKDVRIPLNIRQIDFPPLDVPIMYPNPQDSLEVKILTASKPEGYSATLPVEPAIIVFSNRKTIQGFGLQTIPIDVHLMGVTTYKPIAVNIMSSLGTIDSSHLVLTNNSPKEVILRSEGIGKIDVTVTGTNYPSSSLTVDAVFPWLFLILAILGGLLGGIGKQLAGKDKITLRLIVYSCIIGLLAAVAYWGLGIKLIQFAFEDRGYNESMVFALGLIVGYFGIAIKSKSEDSKPGE